MPSHAPKPQATKAPSISTEPSLKKGQTDSGLLFEDNRPESALQLNFGEIANSGSLQRKENRTGLPDRLKAGMENLSGHSLDDVRVHYNSSKPAQLQALAYAQGSEIHLAQGQERHLPHEAWHVVQQKQGRVKPTMQLKAGVSVNDDSGLELEADLMGSKALSVQESTTSLPLQKEPIDLTQVVQRQYERLTVLNGPGDPQDQVLEKKGVGIVIEMMVPLSQVAIAYSKVDQLTNQVGSKIHTALSIGLNCNIKEQKAKENVEAASAELLAYANKSGVLCAVTPMLWKNPLNSEGGYVFPFIEAHHKLGQAPATLKLREKLEACSENVFHRTMDADVSEDPLTDPKGKYTPLINRNNSHDQIHEVLTNKDHAGKIITGGYKWQTDDLENDPERAKIIELVNLMENWLRTSIEESEEDLSQSLYAPEPNTYIPSYLKDDWDRGLAAGLTDKKSYEIQMGEHTLGRKAVKSLSNGIHYDGSISTTKPRKKWLDNFDGFVNAVKAKDAPLAKKEFDKLKTEIHQSYLNPEVGIKMAKMQGETMTKEKMEAMKRLSQEALDALWQSFQANFILNEPPKKDQKETQ